MVGKKFYFAGKITDNDWRDELCTISQGSINSFDKIYTYLEVPTITGHKYAGPWSISCEHGCHNGESKDRITNGVCTGENMCDPLRAWVVQSDLVAVQKSDILFAWIDSEDCYGTVVEIGYAKALGKQIWIGYSAEFLGEFSEKNDWKNNISPLITDNLSIENYKHHMWFIDQIADKVEVANKPLVLYKKWCKEL